jgi:hypothetical protein
MNTARVIPSFENHERFLKFISIEGECWIFNGAKDKKGYGYFSINRKPYFAHRVSYSIFIAQPKIDLVIDHKCKNKACANPDHLREVNIKTNVMENSDSISSFNYKKELCIRGHLLSEGYLTKKNHRRCKKCDDLYGAKYNESRRNKRKQARDNRATQQHQTGSNCT